VQRIGHTGGELSRISQSAIQSGGRFETGNPEKPGIKVEILISTSGIETGEVYADWLFR
jgi:hypothetical protein